jgi:hypothetical protein
VFIYIIWGESVERVFIYMYITMEETAHINYLAREFTYYYYYCFDLSKEKFEVTINRRRSNEKLQKRRTIVDTT